MTPFDALPPAAMSLLRETALLLVVMGIYNLIRYVQLKRHPVRLAAQAAFTLLNLAFFSAISSNELFLRDLMTLPALFIMLMLLAMSAVSAFQLLSIRRWERDHISPSSVKESVDNLPTGVCFYWPEGLPKLVNSRMLAVCRELTGETLSDAAAFWTQLRTGEGEHVIQNGDKPILRLKDGRAVSFRREKVRLEGHLMYELIAADVTEEYRLSLELMEEEKRARYLNARLKALSASIKYMVMEREQLEIKAHIHNRLGHSLLHARRYLENSKEVSRGELLREWRHNMLVLKNEETPTETAYEAVFDEADALGIRLVLHGTLPDDERLRPVVASALSAHITNVLRHAEGDEVTVSVREEDDRWVLLFRNNGIPPRETVRETGGLGNLRREVELVGGTMEIVSEPQFEMILCLKRGEM